jgi:hypothetical protein
MTAFIRQLETPSTLGRDKRRGEQAGFFGGAGESDYDLVGDVIEEYAKKRISLSKSVQITVGSNVDVVVD